MKKKGIDNLQGDEIEKNLKKFLDKQGDPKDRYVSFDYCFNYFQDARKNGKLLELKKENMQLSCLHLGFYLASWGMYRGSAFLLQRSMKVYEDLVVYIADECNDLWDIDVYNYDKDGNIGKLIKCEGKIREKLGKHSFIKPDDAEINGREATQTLTTKIMLGVFGNVPAFDQYFINASGLCRFDGDSLLAIKKFYDDNSSYLSEANIIKTHDYYGKETERNYTTAKVIDMIFFQKGLTEDQERKKQKSLKKCNTDCLNGTMNFWSIVPAWTTNKYRDINFWGAGVGYR